MQNHSIYKSIFLSHSSRDKGIVEKFYLALTNSNFNLWFDKIDIVPGETIINRVNEGIENAQLLLLFISKNSVTSSWVHYEWQTYISNKLFEGKSIFIMPIILEEVEMPTSLKHYKYVSLKNISEEDAIDEICESITLIQKRILNIEKGYETLQIVDREKIVSEKITIVERHITIRTLNDNYLKIDFHQWQTNPGKSEVVRVSIVDNSNQNIIKHKLKTISKNRTSFHLSCKFKPLRKDQVATIIFEISCRNYHADIFNIGYSQIDFLIRYPIKNYIFYLEVPKDGRMNHIEFEAVYKSTILEIEKKEIGMDRVFKFQIKDLLPMEEIVMITKLNI